VSSKVLEQIDLINLNGVGQFFSHSPCFAVCTIDCTSSGVGVWVDNAIFLFFERVELSKDGSDFFNRSCTELLSQDDIS